MAAVGELDCRYAIHADTGWEHEATYAFAAQWTPWLQERGVSVLTRRGVERDRNPFDQPRVGDKKLALQIPVYTKTPEGKKGILRRQCTNNWKLRPLKKVLTDLMHKHRIKKTPGNAEMLIGISLDEFQRARDSDVAYIKNRFPLLERRMTRQDCVTWLEQHDLPCPPKSSCVFCPYKDPAGWRQLSENDLKIALEIDEKIRDKYPPYPIFVHSSIKPLREALDLPDTEDGETECPGGYCFI